MPCLQQLGLEHEPLVLGAWLHLSVEGLVLVVTGEGSGARSGQP